MSEIYGHRIHGGTGITNFDAELRPLFEAAIKEYGDPNFVIHDEIMPGSPPLSRERNSLHYMGDSKKDTGRFFDIYDRLKAEAA